MTLSLGQSELRTSRTALAQVSSKVSAHSGLFSDPTWVTRLGVRCSSAPECNARGVDSLSVHPRMNEPEAFHIDINDTVECSHNSSHPFVLEEHVIGKNLEMWVEAFGGI